MDAKELSKVFAETELQEYASDLANAIEAYVDARVYQILRDIHDRYLSKGTSAEALYGDAREVSNA
jgi:hypothetical protein